MNNDNEVTPLDPVRVAAVEMLAAMRGDHGPRWAIGLRGNAPNHGHAVPGVWDADNGPDRAGRPCEWCAAWNRFVTAVETAPSATTVDDLIQAPGYYVTPDGLEWGDCWRQFRGHDAAVESALAQIGQYAVRCGRKPGIPAIEDARKIVKWGEMLVRLLEGQP